MGGGKSCERDLYHHSLIICKGCIVYTSDIGHEMISACKKKVVVNTGNIV